LDRQVPLENLRNHNLSRWAAMGQGAAQPGTAVATRLARPLMSIPLPPILVVDDEKNMRASLKTVLGDEGYAVTAVESAEEGLTLLQREDFLMVVTDARLGGMSGYEFLAKVRSQWPEIPVLVITAYATPKLAVEAIKAGAMDYLSKPFAPEELLHAVARCAERHRLLQENVSLRARAGEIYQLDQIVGESPKMRELRQLIQTVAPTDARVLVLGESGTGKELVAGALHSLSQRRQASYIRLNCAAIPETLLESELFGHEKGSFTGALRQKPGRVEEADGGTIFLDEIADMSRPLQAKLLRFLEDGTFTRVGGTQELHVNVRLIAATNRDIVQAIRDGQFREDLFHRLNVVQFHLPPLRERGQDVLLLADHFLKMFGMALRKAVNGFSPAAREKLLAHNWPGNVRELRNVVERALILEKLGEVQASNLPDFHLESRLRQTETGPAPGAKSLADALADFERELIAAVLERNNFSLARTAAQLKITRHALRYRMQRLNISTSTDGDEDTPEGDGDKGSL
jgi:DNA-binding NtrC family response regulator